ncbi:M20/M25/M40 family metallo-hydrolase [Paludibaculum fermentans]|uniref:M20/M25/M40 family metallo-hydrolase n=1 Tax=Paludibaculum fermentans TaxID=1473598 RepID=A0A7S7SLY3_PALFE|nr:M20/M25/M40 family metallo-hydrolase [Paludibaculum fermentans]QOY88525.1 M20/M25/M40 family metallo-hydrolase [Paludibaculum fermentans]
MKCILLLILVCSAANAQNRARVLAEFNEFLKLPNVAADPEGLKENAAWIRAAFERRGVQTQLLEVPGAPAAVYGQLGVQNATGTVLFYAHYDGQPVNPAQWKGSGPFEPSYRGGNPADPETRIYARSASDDKGVIIAMLAALDALRAGRGAPTVNIKFLFEGEEEAGSASLSRILQKYTPLVMADFWIICDGPVHQTRQQQVYFGARGVTGFQLKVYGPRRELHSGHYGNWAPNPAMMLARLLASMKDDEGRVTIPGFYADIDPLTETELAAMKAEPPIDETLMRELWIARTENAPRRLMEVLNQPSFNIRGIDSGAVGEASRNVVPSEAAASVDVRLVKGNEPKAMLEKVKAHIRDQGYFLVEGREPTEIERLQWPKVAAFYSTEGGYRAVRTSMDLPQSRAVIAALEGMGKPLVKMPSLGGSVPLAIIEDVLHVPLIGVPIANHDNNQHSHNENLRLQNLWDGIETMRALFQLPPY